MTVPLPAALVMLALAFPCTARAELTQAAIELELSMTLDPIVQVGTAVAGGRLDVEAAAERLLEEARSVLSGMIYGYRFDYTPSDAGRGVPGVFELEPLASIPRGDESLRVAGTRLEGRRLTVLFRYTLSRDQRTRREAWASSTMEKAAGEGAGNAFLGTAERETALRNAMKESIRSHLRPRITNKPRQVRGDLVLWEVRPTRILAGEYRTSVVTRLRIVSVLPYRVY